MITSNVPFSGIQTGNYTEWCIVCELVQKSIMALNTAIKVPSKGEIPSVNIQLFRKREKSDRKSPVNETKREILKIKLMPNVKRKVAKKENKNKK